MAPGKENSNTTTSTTPVQNIITILPLVMLMLFFFAYCCWGSSCRRHFSSWIQLCQRAEGAESSESGINVDADQPACSPTIILLPQGRVLVVDGTIFSRFHANSTGLDLFELGDRVLRDERNQMTRSASIVELDAEETVKDCASTLPPRYESIFGDYQLSSPPSYSEAVREEQSRLEDS